MTRKIIWIVLAALLLPLVLRLFWFFPGFNLPRSVATPDYNDLKMPQAPISTPAPEQVDQTGGMVLIDYTHGNQFQPDEIQTLDDALAARGAATQLISDASQLASQLKGASAYVIISPAAFFSSDEIHLLQDFVKRGGRLAVFTDATRGLVTYDYNGNPVASASDSEIANPLLRPFGLSFNSDYLYNLVQNEGNFRDVYFDTFGKSDLTWGLKRVALYGVHSVQTDSGLALLIGGDKTLSSETDATPQGDSKNGWAAAALSSDGNVLAIGDFTFFTPPYNTVADNGILIQNIADFLVGGARQAALENFPYVFQGEAVSVLPTSNVQLTAEITGALSRLQSSLDSTNTNLQVVKNPPSSGDLLVLGTFSPSDDLAPYIEPFDLTLDDYNEFVDVPHFGKIGRAGNGLLLFKPGADGNQLVLLADTVDDLTTLMDTLSGGDLSGCVLQNDMGICSIGFGGGFSESTPLPELPEGTPTEEVPTPAG